MLVHMSFCIVWFLSKVKRNSKKLFENAFGKFRKEKKKEFLLSFPCSWLSAFRPSPRPAAS
jgi:hypothetical protein